MIDLDLMTWLIIAVAFLFLMVIALFLEIYENKKLRKFVTSLLSDSIERMGNDIRNLELRFEEMEHKIEEEDKSEEDLEQEQRDLDKRVAEMYERADRKGLAAEKGQLDFT